MTDLAYMSENCACIRVRRAARAVTKRYDEALRPLGITSSQLILLIMVEKQRNRSTNALAEYLGMARTTLVRNMQLLERQGFVRSDVVGKRRRAELTATGRTTLEAAIPLWEQVQGGLVDDLGEQRWHRVKAGLEDLAAAG